MFPVKRLTTTLSELKRPRDYLNYDSNVQGVWKPVNTGFEMKVGNDREYYYTIYSDLRRNDTHKELNVTSKRGRDTLYWLPPDSSVKSALSWNFEIVLRNGDGLLQDC